MDDQCVVICMCIILIATILILYLGSKIEYHFTYGKYRKLWKI